MLLRAVYIRFYKSFNFDYLRKHDRKATTEYPWERADELLYPYVRIPVDERITTVVGANESGKTHLLTAIEKGLSGARIERDDFCRYSQFFAVEEGRMRWPDFGFEWVALSDKERKAVATACGVEVSKGLERFLLFRTNRADLTVYVPAGGEYGKYKVQSVNDAKALLGVLPSVFRLRENIALPESVPIRFLADDTGAETGLATLPRRQRVGLMDSLWSNFGWFHSKDTVAQSADKIAVEMNRAVSSQADADGRRDAERHAAERNLARDLVRKVAKVDAEALNELLGALSEGRDAFANSIIDKINDALQARLNFPRWWVQDREFRLLVSPREYDLAFTIRDRTEKEYAFGERSSGLRYFLSYYIQYLAHDRRTDAREILVMDEPDAYLSNQGQQDLLKIFDAFAYPEATGVTPIQVVYVTHSPFLIDKNHGDRIRVLEKGAGEEGTRVVRDASRNHYEPLRSAFGSFVGETTFIGNCNLIVEGPADQILLAGAASHLRSAGASELENIDLNHITIVPASGAPHVPYLVYLARGRDVEKPAIVVLLDSDSAGDLARKGILRGGPRHKELLKPAYILQLGELCKTAGLTGPAGGALVESEDLVPLGIGVRAVRHYVREVCTVDEETVAKITADAVSKDAVAGEGCFGAIERCLAGIDPELHIEKIGFARAVIETVGLMVREKDPETSSLLRAFESNMKALFRRVRQMQRAAERELTSESVSARVNRAKAAFLQDRMTGAKREHAFVLFEEIERSLDNSEEADEILVELQALRREFKIDVDPSNAIEDYPTFRERLERMRYAAKLATQSSTTSRKSPAHSRRSRRQRQPSRRRNERRRWNPRRKLRPGPISLACARRVLGGTCQVRCWGVRLVLCWREC